MCRKLNHVEVIDIRQFFGVWGWAGRGGGGTGERGWQEGRAVGTRNVEVDGKHATLSIHGQDRKKEPINIHRSPLQGLSMPLERPAGARGQIDWH
jgi:hypothetical protein